MLESGLLKYSPIIQYLIISILIEYLEKLNSYHGVVTTFQWFQTLRINNEVINRGAHFSI